MELNPVNASMVKQAADYKWSSYRQKAGIEKEIWIDCDPTYIGLSDNKHERMQRYKKFVDQDIPEEEIQLIGDALQRGQLTGTHRFIEEVEQQLGIRVEHRSQGRPKKLKHGVVEYV